MVQIKTFSQEVGEEGASQELLYGNEKYHNEAGSQALKSLHKCPEVMGANMISFPKKSERPDNMKLFL